MTEATTTLTRAVGQAVIQALNMGMRLLIIV